MALKDVRSAVRRVAKQRGFDAAAVERLLEIDAEHTFEVEVGGKTYPGFRVQHDNRRGPYKGGVRFHPEVSLDEVRSLATLMSLKTAAVGLPLGGGKGGVAVDVKQLSEAELEEVARQFARNLAEHIGPDKDVPAPDVNTNPKIIDWMVDEYEHLTGDTSKASFTGKSIGNGGSEGRTAATGRGGVIVLNEVLQAADWDHHKMVRIAVQGFGNVGSFFAVVFEREQPSWRLVAATDSSGGVADQEGLNVSTLDSFKSSGNKLKDFDGGDVIDADDIIAADCDVLVLGALGGAVNRDNMHRVRAKIVMELANEPVTAEARDYLTKQGVIIIPDIMANAGGVVVSYLEWVQNRKGEHWTEAQVNKELTRYLVDATHAIWREYKSGTDSLADAAIAVALTNLLEVSGK